MKKIVLLFFISMMAAPCLAQLWKVTYTISLVADACSSTSHDVEYTYSFMNNSNAPATGEVSLGYRLISIGYITAGGTINWKCNNTSHSSNANFSFNVLSYTNPGCRIETTIHNGSHSLHLVFTRLPFPKPSVVIGCTDTVACSIPADNSVNYQWEYSELNQEPWHVFGTNSARVTATVDDFSIPPGSNNNDKKYTNRYIRVIDPFCTGVASDTSESFKFVAPPPTITCTLTDPKCNGYNNGSIQVNITGAPGIHSFVINLYKNGETDPTAQPSITNSSTYTFTQANVTNGMPSGDYSVVVENNTNTNILGSCPSDTVRVPLIAPPLLTATLVSKNIADKNGFDIKCHGGNDGELEVTASGGTSNYTEYRWFSNTVDQLPSTSSTATGLSAEIPYTVKVKDSNECTAEASKTLSQPALLSVVLTSANPIPNTRKDISCHGRSDGSLRANGAGGVAGGTGGYSYKWADERADSVITSLGLGTYSVTVTDKNNCTATANKILTEPEPLTVSTVSITLPSCFGKCDGVLEAQGVGGNGEYRYSWDNATTNPTRDNSCPGTYSVTVTDRAGCTVNSSLSLDNATSEVLNLGGNVTLCSGQSHTLDAGNTWKSVQWTGDNNFTASTHSITVNEAGRYSATAISETDCRSEGSVVVSTSTNVLNAEFALTTQAFVGDTVVFVDISWPVAERVEWNYPNTMERVFFTDSIVYGKFNQAGIYDITLRTHLGDCQKQKVKRITILEKESKPTGGRLGYESFVEQFELYPNPGNGNFQVDITLAEESSVVMSVWSAVDTKLIRTMRLSGHKTYRLQIDLRPLSAGLYILRLDHEKGKENLRFMVE